MDVRAALIVLHCFSNIQGAGSSIQNSVLYSELHAILCFVNTKVRVVV
jgi:hypothetical protein